MTAPDRAAETPMRDHVAKVLDLMAAGGAIRIMDIPNDASHASYTFSGDVSLAVADFVRNTRAPAEALAVQTWQPIETVPKDGTRVDLWSRNGRRICNCDPTAYDLRLITHWTPLPEPPATPAGHWKDACRESNGPEICDEPCSKCLRAIGERADG